MSILDFFGPKIAEPKDFDKDLFIKYYVEYHYCSLIKQMGEDEAKGYNIGWYKNETFYFDGTLISDKCWNSENVATSKKVFMFWLSRKPGKRIICCSDWIRDDDKIDFDSDHVYAKYLARPLLYARLYPNKAISKQILSVLRGIQVLSREDLKKVYESVNKKFLENQAKEAKNKRQDAMNVLLGNTKQK